MLNELIKLRFIMGYRACFNIIFTCFIFCLCISGNSIAEPLSFKYVDVRFNENKVYVDNAFRSVFDLRIESGVNVFGEIIEFFSFIPTQAQAMPENKAEEKSNESNNDSLLHWLFPVFTFVAGLFASGYFTERTDDKKKPKHSP